MISFIPTTCISHSNTYGDNFLQYELIMKIQKHSITQNKSFKMKMACNQRLLTHALMNTIMKFNDFIFSLCQNFHLWKISCYAVVYSTIARPRQQWGLSWVLPWAPRECKQEETGPLHHVQTIQWERVTSCLETLHKLSRHTFVKH